jgi:hypothetical protein
MPTEYAFVDTTADSVMQLHTQERQGRRRELRPEDSDRADVCSLGPRRHTISLAEQAQRQTNTLWFRYEDLLGKIKYFCIKSAGLLPIKHQRIHGPTSDLIIMPVYGGRKKPVIHRHKLGNSLTRFLSHKRDTDRARLEQVKNTLL